MLEHHVTAWGSLWVSTERRFELLRPVLACAHTTGTRLGHSTQHGSMRLISSARSTHAIGLRVTLSP